MSKMCYIAIASIAVATAYNKNPDADFVTIEPEYMDAIVEYFKDNAFYKCNTELTMDDQLKFKGKPVIAYIERPVNRNEGTKGSTTSNEFKKMINKLYGYCASKYTRGTADAAM